MNDVAKSCPVSYGTINQCGGTTCEPCFSRENLDTIRCVWTREFDLNTLPLHGEMFESGRKKILDSKISWYVWTGPEAYFSGFTKISADRQTTTNWARAAWLLARSYILWYWIEALSVECFRQQWSKFINGWTKKAFTSHVDGFRTSI